MTRSHIHPDFMRDVEVGKKMSLQFPFNCLVSVSLYLYMYIFFLYFFFFFELIRLNAEKWMGALVEGMNTDIRIQTAPLLTLGNLL